MCVEIYKHEYYGTKQVPGWDNWERDKKDVTEF